MPRARPCGRARLCSARGTFQARGTPVDGAVHGAWCPRQDRSMRRSFSRARVRATQCQSTPGTADAMGERASDEPLPAAIEDAVAAAIEGGATMDEIVARVRSGGGDRSPLIPRARRCARARAGGGRSRRRARRSGRTRGPHDPCRTGRDRPPGLRGAVLPWAHRRAGIRVGRRLCRGRSRLPAGAGARSACRRASRAFTCHPAGAGARFACRRRGAGRWRCAGCMRRARFMGCAQSAGCRAETAGGGRPSLADRPSLLPLGM